MTEYSGPLESAQLYPFTDPVVAQAEPPRQIASGAGCRVTDVNGETLIDAVSGLWCTPLGLDHQRLIDAATRQMQTLPYYHSFMGRTPAVTETLSTRLLQHLPEPMARVFFSNSGSEAVDSAVKIARFYQHARGQNGKFRIIAREGAYHGSGVVSAALTSMDYCHTSFAVPSNDVLRTGRPHYFRDALPGESEVDFSKRRARELDALIREAGADTIAAMIGEPVIGAGGVIMPPDGYWAAIQEVLARHDVLLIADEIITGFGRTGRWFGCETYGIRPDLMTLAKQLTAAYFPMSAVAVSADVAAQLDAHAHELGTFGHGFTYSGHPVGAAVALETLSVYEDMDLEAHVQELGNALRTRLAPVAELNCVANLRQVGLLVGIEFSEMTEHGNKLAAAVAKHAEANGVLFRTMENTLAIAPPYICTNDDLDEMADVLLASIRATVSG